MRRCNSSHDLLPDRERVLGRDHPDTLTTRSNIAHWTGESGDAREALRLFAELLPDQERVLGRDHPDTLRTRNNIAAWTGRVGDARGVAAVTASCCRTWSGCWAATTPTTLQSTRGHQAAGIGRIPIPGREGRVERSGSLIRRLMSWWKRPR